MLNRVILYVRDMEAVAAFYQKHFGYKVARYEGDRIVDLFPEDGGATIMLHPAGKGQRVGQSTVKLIFDVEDVPGFCERCAQDGLQFGPLHHADGYVFANARDPAQNPISVSGRASRKVD